MKLMPFKWKSFGISDRGLIRTNNEDAWRELPSKNFFILADGVGGHNAGEVAASLAVESMCSSIEALSDHLPFDEISLFLREAIAQANQKVYAESLKHQEYAGMGTTLSCFLLTDESLIYAHIGDSRLYRFRKTLEQLTQDHSLCQISRIKKETQHKNNIITRAVGTYPYIYPDIGIIAVQPEDIYMLCSDGLSDSLDQKTIEAILSAPLSLEEIGKNLIEAALEKGGNDNITVLIVKIEP